MNLLRLPLQILLFFLLAQLLGLYTGSILHQDILVNPYVQDLTVVSDGNAPESAFLFFGYILLGAVFIVVLIRYFFRWVWMFRLLEFMLISTSSSLVFYAVARLALDYTLSMGIGLLLGLLFAAIKILGAPTKNAAAILATAGVGAVFGISLGVIPLMIFLVLLAIYDFVAVFLTKHMVQMARFMIQKEMAFTVTARTWLPAEKGKKPEEKRIDLGTGDLIAPITMEVAVLPWGLTASLFVMLGALLSLGIFLFLVWKRKMVLPALPPIVSGTILFFFLGLAMGLY
ncbi:MAG TPA: presenilin family intramembrane aspartyl protease [Candidatus Bilamarchaeaceae archaeon]|nr:presenilin family intramembrane aspartyl protease [Candidatus Bilamarchaeaceae archaeon]